ncbi:MAG: integration host factor subunit beta [Treponema sp.]|jgi:integration host factor subunit beta|nr:integration host factor subunit beta [Treponema sp.]
MAVNKFTKADIVDAVYDKTGMNRKDVGMVIDLFISEVKAALMKRQVIELRGFGTFEIKMRKARLRARNPKTGEIISIRPHGNVAFRPGRDLKQEAWAITDEDPSSP